MTPPETNEADILPIEAIVVQHGEVAAVLVQTTNSLPFYYANTRGLVVRFSPPSAPGVLYLRADGHPEVKVKAEKQGSFKMVVGCSSRSKMPVDLDIGSLLRAMLPHIKEASYDATTRTIHAGKTNMVLRIVLPDNDAATTFPVREFSITNQGQLLCAVSDIVLDPNVGRGLLSVTLEDLEKLGLPVKVVSDLEPVSLLDPTVRATFATDEGERRGAEKLKDFFDERLRSVTEATAVAKIQQLADHQNLRLSTGPVTWSKQFRFKFRAMTSEKTLSDAPSIEFIVVRNGSGANLVTWLLQHRTGQCRAWRDFFLAAVELNGVTNVTKYVVWPTVGYRFFVKEWTLAAGAAPPIYTWVGPYIGSGTAYGPEMVPLWSRYWDFISATGIPGQNSDTPSEKIFGNHVIVKYQNVYYDPSYGKKYTGEAEFQQSLWGVIISQNKGSYGIMGAGVIQPTGQWIRFVEGS